jgi:Zn-finger nucleic acid-binding protein
MEKVVCGNTHLDKCANEHGIWFDEGELAEMIAYGDINSDVLDLLNDMFANKIKEGD